MARSLLRWLQGSNLFWPRQILDNAYLKEVIKSGDTLKWLHLLTIWALEINHEGCFSVIREDIFVNLMQLKHKTRLDSDERLELDYGIKIKTLKFIRFKRLLWPSHTYCTGYLEQIAWSYLSLVFYKDYDVRWGRGANLQCVLSE